MTEFLTYEMFGAIGDGIADDMPAIVRAHEEANRLALPVRAREGAAYYISPADRTAVVKTSVNWTGARFIIDDRDCENRNAPVFCVLSALEPAHLPITALSRGQTQIDNPTGLDLLVHVENAHHMDYIRKGLNQDNGHPRSDILLLRADGTLTSPVACDFTEVTHVKAHPIDPERLTLTGGEFTTIANLNESRYDYHARNIRISRSNVEIAELTHLVTGETDHGAPYGGFLDLSSCADVLVRDCLFTAHRTYWTIGSAGLPVPMGSYDIGIGGVCNLSFIRCRQTTDILDKNYWGLIGSNCCRDILLEDCDFSRFDVHTGAYNCTLRRCRLGHQQLCAIGSGTFRVEDTEVWAHSFLHLRTDYGSLWRGDVIIRNCTWHPTDEKKCIISASNDGTHYFGYECFLPTHIDIDGFTVAASAAGDEPLFVFNDYVGAEDISPEERPFLPVPTESVRLRNVAPMQDVRLCENPALLTDTAFDA